MRELYIKNSASTYFRDGGFAMEVTLMKHFLDETIKDENFLSLSQKNATVWIFRSYLTDREMVKLESYNPFLLNIDFKRLKELREYLDTPVSEIMGKNKNSHTRVPKYVVFNYRDVPSPHEQILNTHFFMQDEEASANKCFEQHATNWTETFLAVVTKPAPNLANYDEPEKVAEINEKWFYGRAEYINPATLEKLRERFDEFQIRDFLNCWMDFFDYWSIEDLTELMTRRK